MSSQTQGTEPTDTGGQLTTEIAEARRQLVLNRDDHTCSNCGRHRTSVETLDIHHIVPRGQGGSDQPSNLQTLCRRCHNAVHGDGVAPAVQVESTGRMTEVEFKLFRHLMNEVLPALARTQGVSLTARFNVDGTQSWHIPFDAVRQLDAQLAETDDEYNALLLADYM